MSGLRSTVQKYLLNSSPCQRDDEKFIQYNKVFGTLSCELSSLHTQLIFTLDQFNQTSRVLFKEC